MEADLVQLETSNSHVDRERGKALRENMQKQITHFAHKIFAEMDDKIAAFNSETPESPPARISKRQNNYINHAMDNYTDALKSAEESMDVINDKLGNAISMCADLAQQLSESAHTAAELAKQRREEVTATWQMQTKFITEGAEKIAVLKEVYRRTITDRDAEKQSSVDDLTWYGSKRYSTYKKALESNESERDTIEREMAAFFDHHIDGGFGTKQRRDVKPLVIHKALAGSAGGCPAPSTARCSTG